MDRASVEIEVCIRNNCTWNKLPKNIKQLLGNSQKEYEKQIIEYSVKNQLRYKGNISKRWCFYAFNTSSAVSCTVKHVKKEEEQYYNLLLQYSREHLMLFPYHLSDIVVRGLRITPFQYYIGMMQCYGVWESATSLDQQWQICTYSPGDICFYCHKGCGAFNGRQRIVDCE